MKKTAKQFLQIAVAFGGCVPIGAGLAGIILGPSMLGEVVSTVPLDSHFCYLSGLLLGVGMGFWSTIPNIERHGARFQLLTFIVFIGGLGRLWSLMVTGIPDHAMLFGLVMELGVTPLLCLWQHKISKA